MASAPIQFTEFIEEPPVIEITGGVAIIRYRTGNCCAERAFSIKTLARAGERVQRALRMHAAGDDHVIVDD